MSEYIPDNWIVLRLPEDKGDGGYKVLGGWSGGYLDSDHWRLNSGITRVTEDEEFYLFHGHSGSIYRCHKGNQQMRMNMCGVPGKLEEMGCQIVDVAEVCPAAPEAVDRFVGVCFGIVAGTHAFYDIIAAIFNAFFYAASE